MKVAILAGGMGTRLGQETDQRPKAMVEIGGKPILWHIMKFYSSYGVNEFVIALGHMKNAIIRYFLDFHFYGADLTVHTGSGAVTVHERWRQPDWVVHLIDTGPLTETGGRIKRLRHCLGDDTFALTWCDGLSDLNLDSLVAYHRSHGRLATVTAVRAPSRFGHFEFDGERVSRFREKPVDTDEWINGAFFVLEPGIFDYIKDDKTIWEREPMEQLAADGQLVAFRHQSFWHCMDTMQEKRRLAELWSRGEAPWKRWD